MESCLYQKKCCLDDFLEVIELFGDRLFFNDQDILNYLFFEKTYPMEEKYNCLVETRKDDLYFNQIVEKAHILHFAGGAPWKIGRSNRCDLKLWWDIADRTPLIVDISKETLENISNQLEILNKFNDLQNSYITYKESGKRISEMPALKNKRHIAVYGAGLWGRRLIEELDRSGLKIKFVFDREKQGNLGDYTILGLDAISMVDECDALIITPMAFFDSIVHQVRGQVHCQIISVVDCFRC